MPKGFQKLDMPCKLTQRTKCWFRPLVSVYDSTCRERWEKPPLQAQNVTAHHFSSIKNTNSNKQISPLPSPGSIKHLHMEGTYCTTRSLCPNTTLFRLEERFGRYEQEDDAPYKADKTRIRLKDVSKLPVHSIPFPHTTNLISL